MFRNFPELSVSKGPFHQLDDGVESTEADGFVLRTQFPTAVSVALDAHALLRITKHARDAAPRPAFGRLLGMQRNDRTLEITSAVPAVQTQLYGTQMSEEERDKKDADGDRSHLNLMSKAGYDSFVVGRYAACGFGLHLTLRQLGLMNISLRNGDPSVLLTYDSLRSSMGKLWLKAYVPGPKFFDAFPDDDENKKPQEFSAEELATAGILREVPVEVRVSTLQAMFLRDSVVQKPRAVCNQLAAKGELGMYAERVLGGMSDGMDRLRTDVNSRSWALQNGETVVFKPETQLMMQQLREQSTHLSAVCSGSLLALDFASKHVKN